MIKNNLWKPTNKIKTIVIPKIVNDPLCETCPNKERSYINKDGQEKKMKCMQLCPPMQWINGNTPTKETLLSEINASKIEYRDYKDTLCELIEHKRHRIDKIPLITNIKHKAISILLIAGIPQKDISNMFSMSLRQIVRISNYIK